ncbi:hypothetical protein R1Y80_11080 [Streptomyces sp. JL1001]|uniref:Uncharacterized protein n=1 Tax=Streptomyces sp. JL1001 TaxID=3078227 RepID=A0AAU8KDW0_9ACTN
MRGRTGVPRTSRPVSLQAAGSDQGSPGDEEDSRRTGSGAAGGPWPSSSATRSAIRRFVGRGSSRRHSAPATPARQSPYITTTQVAGARPAYRPWISAAHHAGYASACRTRHRPAIPPVSRGDPSDCPSRAALGEGWAKALRSAPVAAVTTISSPASEPKPISPAAPVTPRLKGMRAPIRATWPRATFTVPCSSRKPSAAMAVARWMPWQTIR